MHRRFLNGLPPATREYLQPLSSALIAVVLVSGIGPLETQQICRAAPVADAKFDAVDNYGVKQINVGKEQLLVGAGFGFIGSRPGAPDSENNISTASKYSKDGVMRPFNNSPAGGSLPYSLKFTKDAKDPAKLHFSGSLGPASDDFSTVSIPMDCSRQFTYWRSSNSTTLHRYDQSALAYQHEHGPVNMAQAPIGAKWGEIIGAKYTIRVTLEKSSRPMNLFFVDHPDTRNVEFSFGAMGTDRDNKSATVSGFIQVSRTDPELLSKREQP